VFDRTVDCRAVVLETIVRKTTEIENYLELDKKLNEGVSVLVDAMNSGTRSIQELVVQADSYDEVYGVLKKFILERAKVENYHDVFDEHGLSTIPIGEEHFD
jgi:hypothetical protein